MGSLQTTTLIESFETELNLLFYGVKEGREEKLDKLFGVIRHGFHEEDWLQESTTLCQTAFELNEALRAGYRHRSEADQSELNVLALQLEEAGLLGQFPLPTLQAIDELSYRTALQVETIVEQYK